MPGAYTHITLANELRAVSRLEAIPGFPEEAIDAVLAEFKFCELGAVSPDYPYLSLADGDAAKWADNMHYTRTGEVIQTGVGLLRQARGEARRKGLAWLLGYTSHVVADVTVHPVVNLRVGPYEENKTTHRTCEMNEDAYIFRRLNVGEVGLSEHLDSGIRSCGSPKKLDRDVEGLWKSILKEVYPEDFAANEPDIHKWHRAFGTVVDAIGEGNHLLPLSRHVAAGVGLTYPARDDLDESFLTGLKTPAGAEEYDIVFDRAVAVAAKTWGVIARGICAGDDLYLAQVGNWNLDTGRDPAGELVFWG